MKHVTIAILTPSVILQKGITSILTGLPDITISILDISENFITQEIHTKKPTIIITDPLLLNFDDLNQIKSQSKGKTHLIAISNTTLPQSLSKEYNGVISIYDSTDTIRKVILENISTEDSTTKELTPREKEIVIGIVKGLSNKEIAEEINVSVNTVMTHRRNIAAKLQIHSAAGLTIYAIVSKLVKLEDIKSVLTTD